MSEVAASVIFGYLLPSLSFSALQSSSWQGKRLTTCWISAVTFSRISDYYGGRYEENLSWCRAAPSCLSWLKPPTKPQWELRTDGKKKLPVSSSSYLNTHLVFLELSFSSHHVGD